nr:uncharacterized protein LOC112709147 [Arachis hypogaea]
MTGDDESRDYEGVVTMSTVVGKRKYPISQYMSYDILSPKHKSFSLAVATTVVPSNYKEAIVHPCCREAIHSELEALKQNQTGCIIKLPAGKKSIGCKWVFRMKLHPDSTVERYKARLVAKGFTQIEGVDFIDKFSPVVHMTTLRIVLALAAAKQWHIK